MFWLTFLASIAFWPGVIDPALSPRWSILAVGITLLMLLKTKQPKLPLSGLGFLTLILFTTTLLWTPDVYVGMYDLSHLLILAAAICLGAELKNLNEVWKGLYAGVAVNIFILFLQYINWSPLPAMTLASGLFINKEIFAETAMIAFLSAVFTKRYGIATLMFIPIIACYSRTVWLAIIIVAAVVAGRKYKTFIYLAGLSCIAIPALVYIKTAESFTLRIEMWKIALTNLKLWGHGLGSWAATYPTYEYTHNELLQAIYEFGILTLLPIFIVVQILRKPTYEAEYFIFISIMVVSFFWFPYHMPITGFIAALATGYLANSRNIFFSKSNNVSSKNSTNISYT